MSVQGAAGAILDGAGLSGAGIRINSRNYIRVTGMTVRNFRAGGTPMGIDVDGSSSFIELRNNLIHNIESPNGNAHGIAFYGTASTPMTNIVVEGNEIRNCWLGQSESLVLNGNINGFTVARNIIHDNDNIGIDPYADLHLMPGSPAIDAGIDLGNDGQGQPVSGVSDIDGQPRVRGGAMNIGVHEFMAGAP